MTTAILPAAKTESDLTPEQLTSLRNLVECNGIDMDAANGASFTRLSRKLVEFNPGVCAYFPTQAAVELVDRTFGERTSVDIRLDDLCGTEYRLTVSGRRRPGKSFEGRKVTIQTVILRDGDLCLPLRTVEAKSLSEASRQVARWERALLEKNLPRIEEAAINAIERERGGRRVITGCPHCGKLLETTTEDADSPDYMCATCSKEAAARRQEMDAFDAQLNAERERKGS